MKIFNKLQFTVNGLPIILQGANTRLSYSSVDPDNLSVTIDLGYNCRITVTKQL